jgi:hypothetical protein
MKIIKYADGASSRPLEKWLVINSETIFIGGPVRIAAGGVAAADAVSDPIYGICKGFVADGGSTPLENALSGQFDGTLVDGVSYTASADNETDKKVQALVEPILPNDTIRAEMDATLGNTTGSNKVGYYADVLTTDERKLDESNTSTNQLQFIIVGQPGKGNFVDVKLVENQINGNVQA